MAKPVANSLCEVVRLRWSRLSGQFGGEAELICGFVCAASWSVSAGGASPAGDRISFAPEASSGVWPASPGCGRSAL